MRLKKILKKLRGEGIRFELDLPGRRLTSFRLGGEVSAAVFPRNIKEVVWLLAFLEQEGIPYFFLGGGTNLIIKDGGFPGLAVSLRDLRGLDFQLEPESVTVSVLSGEPLRNLVSLGIKLGLKGVESLAGIPGTVGGAIAMNAGTPEGAIGDFLEEIFVVFPGASPLKLKARDLSFSYRKTSLPQEALILQATLRFLRTSPLQVAQAVGEMCRKRAKSQPLRYPSAGCVFKNPPGDSAGRLIDLCGLKGKRHGGAQISTRHANFIINRGGARARDVLELMDMAREAVFKKFTICLEPEVRIIGQG